MGRRPNPLMAEFFERGAKIGDMSNRYEQTCKRCGEHFARGRSEAMVTHLTKKCPSITHSERAKIIFRLHDLAVPDVHPYIDPTYNPETGQSGGTLAEQDNSLQTAGISLVENGQQNFDGLNVLAEASRRVGRNAQGNAGYSPTNQDGPQAEAAQLHDDVPLDPQLEADGFSQHLLHDDSMDARHNGFPVTTGESLAPLYTDIGNVPTTSQGDLASLPLVSTGPSDLSTIAATAHATLANGDMMDTDIHMSSDVSSGILDHLHGFPSEGRQPFPWPTLPSTQPIHQPTISTHPVYQLDQPFIPSQPTGGLPLQPQQLRPIAMHPNRRPSPSSEDPDALAQVPKSRVRGRFAPERRKEVRELRKVGACMRCRMLKKTCSQETPCQTCAAVESPRLWKVSCVRTKLDDEFPLYFTMPYGVLAHHELENLKKKATFQPFVGRLEASHFSGQKIIFKARQASVQSALSGTREGSDQIFAENQVVVLMDLETDNVQPKVERYLQTIYSQIIDREPSSSLQASLHTAQAIKKRQQGTVRAEKHDNLISEIIELWAATAMITDIHLKASFTTDTGLPDGRSPINETKNEVYYRVLTMQLRAAIEKRAGIVCRSILHHFEQRVLSRNKSNNFETFLVAFILLNCAERMCWLYRRMALPGVGCPLDGKPEHYAEKAESFAQTIQMLLSMRQLEPKIMVDPNTGFIIARNRDDTGLTEWLAAAGFTRDVAVHLGPANFDPDDGRSLDGSFAARLLQP